MIRNVIPEDALCITEIYNYYIENTIITFETQKISEQEMSNRIENILNKNFPYIVFEDENKMIGYAYLNNWRNRAAYNITLETSIYLDIKETGKGYGKALYEALISEARKLEIHSLIGGISLPNEPSRKLHEYFNFRLVGNFKESGSKFNQLIDVEFWQLILE